MTVREMLQHNPPPGMTEECRRFLVKYGEAQGWGDALPSSGAAARPALPPDMASVERISEATGVPIRSVRSHAKKFCDDLQAPVAVDRRGPRKAYRLSLSQYAAWRAKANGGVPLPEVAPEEDPELPEDLGAKLRDRVG